VKEGKGMGDGAMKTEQEDLGPAGDDRW